MSGRKQRAFIRSGVSKIACALATVGLAACSAVQTPPSSVAGERQALVSDHAELVFLWPRSSCEPAGWYTVVDETGRFVATITAGSRVSAVIPEGEHFLVAWNQGRERSPEAAKPGQIAVMNIQVVGASTYYVELAFGEWSARGPTEVYSYPGRAGMAGVRRLCPNREAILRPFHFNPMLDWTPEELAPFQANLEGGAAALERDPEAVQHYVRLGLDRWAQITEAARASVTLNASDGVPWQY